MSGQWLLICTADDLEEMSAALRLRRAALLKALSNPRADERVSAEATRRLTVLEALGRRIVAASAGLDEPATSPMLEQSEAEIETRRATERAISKRLPHRH